MPDPTSFSYTRTSADTLAEPTLTHDRTIDRLAWCLRSYHNAAQQGRVVSTDVVATATQALREYDTTLQGESP